MRIPILRLELRLRVALGICITADRPCFGDEKEAIHASPPSIQR
jgi:hypothetical protein